MTMLPNIELGHTFPSAAANADRTSRVSRF